MYNLANVSVETADIPKSSAGRPKRENPLHDLVVKANKARGKATTFTLALPDNNDEAEKIVATIKRDLSRSARELDIMVRRQVNHDVLAKTVTVTFWCADRPAKPAKPADKKNDK